MICKNVSGNYDGASLAKVRTAKGRIDSGKYEKGINGRCVFDRSFDLMIEDAQGQIREEKEAA